MYKFSYFEECFVILNTNVVCNLEKLASHVKTFNCTLGYVNLESIRLESIIVYFKTISKKQTRRAWSVWER